MLFHGKLTPMRRSLAPVLLFALASGCYLRHGPERDPPTRVPDAARPDATVVPPPPDGARPDAPVVPPPRTRTVDLLFVIDNSISMVEEQSSLTSELPRMVNILSTGDFDQDGDFAGDGEVDDEDFEPVHELSIGVVTTDMGSGDHLIPTCDEPTFGDDGRLRSRGSGVSGCLTAYPSFLTYRTGGDPARFAFDVECVAAVGTGGCGIEQPLEAALKALSPARPRPWTAPFYVAPTFFEGTSGHGDGVSAGFIHPGGVLGVFILSDDDDCSARDPDLFDPASPDFEPGMNLRCFRHGADSLYPIERYVDGLLQLRREPARLVFAPIVGIPTDLVPAAGSPPEWDRIAADDRMIPRIDPRDPSELAPSCNVPGLGLAYPPTRTLAVARGLEARGARIVISSICQAGFTNTLGPIIEAL